MGYRSQVYFKTTTEGWLVIKTANDEIKEWNNQPLAYSTVQRTPAGNYKITWDDIKWYPDYKAIQTFNDLLHKLESMDIPFSFIRIGEDYDDIEFSRNYPDDMPYEIEAFEPVIDVNDEEWGDYEDYIDFNHPEAESK